MHEHLSKDAKNAEVTPLISHMATLSTFPQLGWLGKDDDDDDDNDEEARAFVALPVRLFQKLLQLVEVVAAI